MSNFKSITEVPMTESTEGLYLIANKDGAAAQIEPEKIGAQADWNETDENSPAFVKNKPETGGNVTIFTYFSDDGNLYLKDNPDEDFILPHLRGAMAGPTNATLVTYDMLDKAMRNGGVLCDITDYYGASPMVAVADPVYNSKYGTVISYGRYGDSEDYYEWYVTTFQCDNIATLYFTFGNQPK